MTTRSSASNTTMFSSSTGSSSISTAYFKEVLEQLKYQQHQPSTDITYHRVWTLFNQFYIQLDRKPEKWEDRLALFGVYLVKMKKQSPTIKSYLSAVKSVLLAAGVDLNPDWYKIIALIWAGRIRNDKLTVRPHIQKSLTHIILDKKQIHFENQYYLSTLYCAMISTGY